MIVGIIAEIAGDCARLERALSWFEDEGILSVFNAGSTSGPAGSTGMALTLCDEYGIPTVMGDYDRDLLKFARKRHTSSRFRQSEHEGDMLTTLGQIEPCDLERLQCLPKTREYQLECIPIHLSHYGPGVTSGGLDSDSAESRFQRAREAVSAKLVFWGSAPEAMHRMVHDTLFVCPGPLAGEDEDEKAHFAIVNTEKLPWKVEFMAV